MLIIKNYLMKLYFGNKMKFSQLLEDLGVPISTASFAGWSVNPSGIGFDMPWFAGNQLKKKRKKSILFGLNRRNYANAIGTTKNYYNKEINKIL